VGAVTRYVDGVALGVEWRAGELRHGKIDGAADRGSIPEGARRGLGRMETSYWSEPAAAQGSPLGRSPDPKNAWVSSAGSGQGNCFSTIRGYARSPRLTNACNDHDRARRTTCRTGRGPAALLAIDDP
jgi:hypothetical protein